MRFLDKKNTHKKKLIRDTSTNTVLYLTVIKFHTKIQRQWFRFPFETKKGTKMLKASGINFLSPLILDSVNLIFLRQFSKRLATHVVLSELADQCNQCKGMIKSYCTCTLFQIFLSYLMHLMNMIIKSFLCWEYLYTMHTFKLFK